MRRHFSWQKQFKNSTAAKSLLANQRPTEAQHKEKTHSGTKPKNKTPKKKNSKLWKQRFAETQGIVYARLTAPVMYRTASMLEEMPTLRGVEEDM